MESFVASIENRTTGKTTENTTKPEGGGITINDLSLCLYFSRMVSAEWCQPNDSENRNQQSIRLTSFG